MFKNHTVLTRLTELPNHPASDRSGKRRAKGVAAVEFAVILPVIVILLFVPIYFARVFMHYSVAEKAAHSAALYLASVPRMDMEDQDKALAAADIASQIVDITIAELKPGRGKKVLVQVQCDGGPCGNGRPANVTVFLRMRMYDDFFLAYTQPMVGYAGIPLAARVTIPYTGG